MDLFKNNGVKIGAAVAAVIALGGLAFWGYTAFSGGGGDSAGSDAPPVLPPRPSKTPIAQTSAPKVPTTAKNAVVRPVETSWDKDPSTAPTPTPASTGDAGGQLPGEGVDSTPSAAASTALVAKKPAPIQNGVVIAGTRRDPFVTFLKVISVNPPAYSLVAPLRIASYPKLDISDKLPLEDQIGPLPAVSRRVAGVITSNGVSAILENGEPGNADTTILVQPGSEVDSLIPGIGKLTVESINSNGLTLRAPSPDNRKVAVKLSVLPSGVLQSLLGGGGARGNGGGFPGAAGGYPGAGGGGKLGGGAGAF